MSARLAEAAESGDVGALYREIKNSPSVLDTIETTPFIKSPLHIAAQLGHAQFALEMVMMKPSLARKLDESCHSPMHLAVMSGHQDLVKGLLSIDKDLVRVKGSGGRTPLHWVAATEGVSSLCPEAFEDLTFRRETLLHLAVLNDHFDAYRVLIEFIEEFHFHKQVIYGLQDVDGCTALHHATNLGHLEMARFLFCKYQFMTWNLGIGFKDKNGQTVQGRINELLQEDAQRTGGYSKNKLLWNLNFWCKWQLPGIRRVRKPAFQRTPTESRDALLVVVTLVITATMQLGVNPPAGFWQDDSKADDEKEHFAGWPILHTNDPVIYYTMTMVTVVGFAASLSLIFAITRNMPMKTPLRLVLVLFLCCYVLSFLAVSGPLTLVLASLVFGIFTLIFWVILACRKNIHFQRDVSMH